MTKIRFEKVSLKEFGKDWIHTFKPTKEEVDGILDNIDNVYNNIKLPVRGTKGSAGYDISTPTDIDLQPGEDITFPTGIKAFMPSNYVFLIFPRSGLGFKNYLHLANTIGVIDSDYVNSDNEGHIMVKVRNDGDKFLHLNAGDRVCQGIFVQYGVTSDDSAESDRAGGFGSTGA